MYRTQPGMFLPLAFRLLHPGVSYLHNWSVDVLGEALARCHERQSKRLIINTPQRSLKSVCASVAFPAWVLGVRPESKIMCIAGHRTLAEEQHDLARRLMKHPRYRALFPHARVGESTGRLWLAQGGFRAALTPSDALTGLGADMIIIDDPQSAHDADDPQKGGSIRRWYDGNIYQRLDDKHEGVIIVVMQRLSHDDLTAHLLDQGGWEHVNLPAIAVEDEYHGGRLRRRPGEALHPAREDLTGLRDVMLRMGAKAFMAQYQQAPYPPDQCDTSTGLFHTAPHPDASADEFKYTVPWFGEVEEEVFLLDLLFGERTCIRRGGPPPMTTDEWVAWGDSMTTPEGKHEPAEEESVQPGGECGAPGPGHTDKFHVGCEPCSRENIEALKRPRGMWG
ncbi:MAG: hypothetical protein CMJ35_14205 [Phycisphaerae bacterium]|nr:hypothetical protein [Phycisphaerae bacterium]